MTARGDHDNNEREGAFEVRPDQDLARWEELAAAPAAMFQRAVERGAVLRSRIEKFLVRLVFGYAELREKVLLADAGLSRPRANPYLETPA